MLQIPELEERTCAEKTCTIKFKCIPNSPKLGCSLYCEKLIDPSKFVSGLPRRGAFKPEAYQLKAVAALVAPEIKTIEPARPRPTFRLVVPEISGQCVLVVDMPGCAS